MKRIRRTIASFTRTRLARQVTKSQLRRKVLFETLELRLPLTATAELDAGLLSIQGDALAANHVQIAQTAQSEDGVTIQVTLDGLSPLEFVGVKSIEVLAGEGDDTVQLLSVITVDTSLQGGGGDDTLIGPDEEVDWILTDNGAGTVADIAFSDFERLVGGNAADSFQLQPGGTVALGIDGGDGSDVLLATDVANTWAITGADSGTLADSDTLNVSLAFEGIENLIGGRGADLFQLASGGSVSGTIDGGIDEADAASPPVDELSYAGRSAAIKVDLSGEELTATDVAVFDRIDAVRGGSGADKLIGLGEGRVTWTVTAANAGDVAGLAFASFEHLVGADLTASDLFIFEAGGSISGSVSGGSGTADGIKVYNSAEDTYTIFNPPEVDSAGLLDLHGRLIVYSGIDNQALTSGDAFDRIVYGSVFDDRIIIENGPTPGQMQVRFDGNEFFDGISSLDALVFPNPADSLTIYGLDGRDHIEVKSLDELFSADLLIYGSRLPIVGSIAPIPEEDPYNDTVVFSGDIDLQGGFLDVWAETIRVESGVDIAVGDNDIVFRARSTGIAQLENLLPLYATFREVEISIGSGATLSADGGIYLIAEADDKSIADLAGVPREVDKFVIEPLMDQISGLTALPVKVLTKNSTATVTLHEDAKLHGGGTVGIYATAGADASGSAAGSLFSIGYANANAVSRIDVHTGAEVVSTDEAVVITADGSATANLSPAQSES